MYQTSLHPAQPEKTPYQLVSPIEPPAQGLPQLPIQYQPTPPPPPPPVYNFQQTATQGHQYVSPPVENAGTPAIVLSAPIASNAGYAPAPPEIQLTVISPTSSQTLAEKLEAAVTTVEIEIEEKPPVLVQQEITPYSGEIYFPPPPTSSSKTTLKSKTPVPALKDEKKVSGKRRFFGDTLVGRVARASIQTVTSVVKMPASLSPWGDNNPVTLPNVRYRDAVLFTAFAFVGGPLVHGGDVLVGNLFGTDSFISEIVSSSAGFLIGHAIIRDGLFQIVEQAIDIKLLDRILPEEEKLLTTTGIKTLQITIKHKLMGVDADLRLHNVRSTSNISKYEKGWFCPYLFASARTPSIPRAMDFEIAQCFGPFLAGDYALAHKLLNEIPSVYPLCDVNPSVDIGCNRMLVLFTGIVPYRAEMWSTSRRPGAAVINFHLLNGCPGLVVPVTHRAPIVAWSPYTLEQMHHPWFVPETQHNQICEFLDTIVSKEHLPPAIGEKYEAVLGRAVSMVINGALKTKQATFDIMKKIDKERAGIVMFRY